VPRQSIVYVGGVVYSGDVVVLEGAVDGATMRELKVSWRPCLSEQKQQAYPELLQRYTKRRHVGRKCEPTVLRLYAAVTGGSPAFIAAELSE